VTPGLPAAKLGAAPAGPGSTGASTGRGSGKRQVQPGACSSSSSAAWHKMAVELSRQHWQVYRTGIYWRRFKAASALHHCHTPASRFQQHGWAAPQQARSSSLLSPHLNDQLPHCTFLQPRLLLMLHLVEVLPHQASPSPGNPLVLQGCCPDTSSSQQAAWGS